MATWQAVRATRAETVALREALTAERVVDFLVSLFESATPGQTRGTETTARDLLERGVKQIAAGLQDEPRVQVRLLNTLSRAHSAVGVYDRALDLAQQATAAEREGLGQIRDEPEFSSIEELVRNRVRP